VLDQNRQAKRNKTMGNQMRTNAHSFSYGHSSHQTENNYGYDIRRDYSSRCNNIVERYDRIPEDRDYYGNKQEDYYQRDIQREYNYDSHTNSNIGNYRGRSYMDPRLNSATNLAVAQSRDNYQSASETRNGFDLDQHTTSEKNYYMDNGYHAYQNQSNFLHTNEATSMQNYNSTSKPKNYVGDNDLYAPKNEVVKSTNGSQDSKQSPIDSQTICFSSKNLKVFTKYCSKIIVNRLSKYYKEGNVSSKVSHEYKRFILIITLEGRIQEFI
jgi:hypothetical protein